MTVLRLESDSDSIDFISTTNFELIEDTLQLTSPEREDVRISTHRKIAGRTLRYSAYRSRKFSFTLRIKDTSDKLVSDAIQRISRMISRASDDLALSGGSYGQTLASSGTHDTGDQGVILRFSLGPTNNTSIASERTGSSFSDPNLYTARVLTGDIVQSTGLSHSTRQINVGGTTYYFRLIEITLEIEPILMKTSRVVATLSSPGTSGGAVSPANSNINRMFIPAANIPGDVEALTRITTQVQGAQGIIIARDAGISLLNSTSVPVYNPATGGNFNDMYCYGDTRSATGKTYTVKITGSNTCQYKVNSGSYSSNMTIVANTPMQLSSDPVYIYFWNATGHITNDTWTFNNNQAYFPASVTFDAYTNRSDMYSNNGALIKQWNATVPPGCTSKYKVLVLINSDAPTEYTMTADFIGYGGPGGRVVTGSQDYDWVMPPNYHNGYIDLGIIDLTPNSTPFIIHPGLVTEIGISFYARAINTLTSGNNVACSGMYLIPVQDEYAFMHAVWTYDGYGREVYCNYDSSYPYIAEIAANYLDNNNLTNVSGVGLNGTYAGNVITLVPGTDNTIMILPVFSTDTMDWRGGTFITAGQTSGDITISCRPRYLQV